MAKIVRREIRKRGFFGWVFFLLFLGFNALMAVWLVAAIIAINQGPQYTSEAEKVGATLGAAVGFSAIAMTWVVGSVITGLLALVTRGRKTIIEETSP